MSEPNDKTLNPEVGGKEDLNLEQKVPTTLPDDLRQPGETIDSNSENQQQFNPPVNSTPIPPGQSPTGSLATGGADNWSDAKEDIGPLGQSIIQPDTEATSRRLLDSLLSRVKVIEELHDEIVKLDERNVTLHEVECYERLLEEEWRELMELRSPMLSETLIDHEYNHVRSHQQASKCRRSALLAISRTKSKLEAIIDRQKTSTTKSSVANNLPRLSFTPFNGDFAAWKEFSDIFQSVIGKTDMDDVEKFIRLRSALTGPAADLLKTFSTTDDSYQKAWEKLRNTYENPRLIAQTLFNRILKLPRISQVTSEQILSNVHTTRETFDQLLTSAGISRESIGEQFFVHILRSSLDADTRKDLEVKIGTATTFTTLTELTDFLTATARGLRAGEGLPDKKTDRKQSGQSSQRSAAAHQVSPTGNNDPPPRDTRNPDCPCCSAKHFIGKCHKFRSLSILQKRDLILKARICFNCLGWHNVTKCGSGKRCLRCHGKHHTQICERGELDANGSTTGASLQPGGPNITTAAHSQGQSSSHSTIGPIHTAVQQCASTDTQPNVLLATALARAYSSTGNFIVARLLIDQGSELTFITEHLVNQLRLRRRPSTIHLKGIGNTDSGHTRGVVTVLLASTHQPHQQVNLNAYILGRLTTRLPSFSVSSAKLGTFRQLQLADAHFLRPGPIDILLGADNYARITQHRSLTSEKSDLVGQLTTFGWTLCGQLTSSSELTGRVFTAVRQDSCEELVQLLQKFWVQEDLPKADGSINKNLTPEEQECEQHFMSTHTRDSTGRYTIRLPLRVPASGLGESRHTALRQAYSVNRRLKSDSNYRKLYTDFINEYESSGHMQKAPASPEPSSSYYLPHHGVLRAESLTTKLRVVFNGSSKTSTALSLNDILHTGKKLQVDAMDVLTWMRLFKFVFGTDIAQMFRQINVHPDDWDLQRILWINDEQQVIPYQLKTVTYGMSCSPWLALRVLQQLTTDEGQRFPQAIQCISKGRYVDDIYGGANSEAELEKTITDLQQLCMAGGFPLHKWASNNPRILERLGLHQATPTTVTFEESIVKVLGLCWQPSTDNFHYKSRKFTDTELTKRRLLSEIAQIFDPLGFLAPVIIRAKVLIQELWCLKLGWDELLPTTYSERWILFRTELTLLDQLSIPRWLGTSTEQSGIQIHGFADASTTAMGAVVYLRVEKLNGSPTITLVCAKTKVAPLKRLTVPRLELTAALLLTELVQHAQRMLEMEDARTILWTDSSVTLAWINSHPSRWKDFVHNRVVKIQETLPNAQWNHISGTDNPADCASRGISTSQLIDHSLWWTGPSWLQLPENQWPQPAQNLTKREETLEQKPAVAHPVAQQQHNEIATLMDRYPKLSKLLQVTATINRAISRFRRQPVPDSPILTTQELERARLFWTKLVQRQYFNQEIQQLRNGHQLPRNHQLSKLTPLIDEFGIMRLGGRLSNAPLDPDQIHPIILPKDSPLSEMIIKNAHLKTLHGGNQQTLAYVREKYWIIGGRPTVKAVIHRCLRCARFRGQRAYQLMGQLPASRVTPSRPFLHTGVDYAGPYPVLKWTGKGSQTQTGYIAVFVCFATGAIHLELVSSQSTDAFLAAYKRFTGRRGIPEVMYSDRGATFIGAAGVLQRSAEKLEQEQKEVITQIIANGTQWKFIPPRAAHFGGKWEAGVKSMKYHLKRVIGDSRLTFEEMTTLLAQIEAILNSRPISQLSDDPTDSTALTPGHFLIGSALATVPEPSRLHESQVKPPRWKWITQKTQDFWNQWYRECIQKHQSLSKWKERNQNIRQGQLVLVSEDGQTPSRWPLAIVVKRYVGKDGIVRVVDLRCNQKIIRRAIHKLCVLPIMPIQEEENQREDEIEALPEEEVEPGPSNAAPEESTSDDEHQRNQTTHREEQQGHQAPDDEDHHRSKRPRLGD